MLDIYRSITPFVLIKLATGKFTEIKVVGFERGGITTDLRERPTVRYDVDVMKDTARSQNKVQADKPVAKGN